MKTQLTILQYHCIIIKSLDCIILLKTVNTIRAYLIKSLRINKMILIYPIIKKEILHLEG